MTLVSVCLSPEPEFSQSLSGQQCLIDDVTKLDNICASATLLPKDSDHIIADVKDSNMRRHLQSLNNMLGMCCCCCCCRPHSTNVLPAESSTRNHVAASSLSPQVARKGSTLSGFVQRSRLEREVGRDLHSNKWEEV